MLLLGPLPALARVQFRLMPSHPLLPIGQTTRVYLKLGLKGLGTVRGKRAPVNLAVVLDRSGSMSGAKIRKAKEAARMVLELLRPDDIFCLVTYDSTIRVLVPATKVTDKLRIQRKIDRIRPGGFTALYGGVKQGIAEVRKFFSRTRINRVILLSDGLANVGPSSPAVLGQLGRAAGLQGISITTVGLGLGYNEDLMSRLAQNSDGNHAFARNAQDLARIFRGELGEIMSIIAQDVLIMVECGPGVRPIRVLNRSAQIRGRTVTLKLNQLLARQEKYVLLEVEVPKGRTGSRVVLATAKVRYTDLKTRRTDRISQAATVSYSGNPALVKKQVKREVMVGVAEAIGNAANRQAVALRDKGKVAAARQMLMRNSAYLAKAASRYRSAALRRSAKDNKTDAKSLKGRRWLRRRKVMREMQLKRSAQRSY